MKKIFLCMTIFCFPIFPQIPLLQKYSYVMEGMSAKDTLTKFTTFVWDSAGTSPTGVIAGDDYFRFEKLGNIMMFAFHIYFDTAGVNNTEVTFRLPSDEDVMLLPIDRRGNGQVDTLDVRASATINNMLHWNCFLIKNASEEYTVVLQGTSQNVRRISGMIWYYHQ